MMEPRDNLDWPRVADELGERFDVDCIESSVRGRLKAGRNNRLLVACSGGADSVFMLCLFAARRAELGLELHVAHYNHRWRGEASQQDEDFVRGITEGLKLPFYFEKRPENEAAFTETTARSLRLDFLRKVAREADCPFIAFGHQLDDILETQLQRLARGVGTEGLAAPRPVAEFSGQPTHLRPLLHLRSGDIRMTLNAVGIPWREDGSNEDTSIARNMLRHEVIPDLIEALDRDPSTGAARSRQLLEEDACALDLLARERMPEAFSSEERLSRVDLCALPRALMRRALVAWLNAHELTESFSASAMDMLIDSLLSQRRTWKQSAGASFICSDKKSIWVEEEEEGEAALQHVQFEPGETVVLSSGYLIESDLQTLDEKKRDAILCGRIDPSFEATLILPSEESLHVRGWRPGDRFTPLGSPGAKKLKDWFIDRGIPRKERKRLPVVTTASGEVIWVPGFPPADRYKINRDTKQALRLTYRPRNPR
ncbi:tRNA lysidine(34) synthetase TilS [Coraliomargarita sinensis]|uniref:tRNA(Ile)-lysidine synthase n=1 Tax=Coraliomargarita sinensis TaxID=2174842 RepID=A0A317ZII5_9BACT|nr:tRNA lysidine(34) synthetase TilS [Coraliomargarita sinensis]PXA03191.1 tRNA lysidine(34) synthetase TilS [Coraliomargarita sinensis]